MIYSQPEYYHFSQDSLDLASYAVKNYDSPRREVSTLDLGAGCGVVGLQWQRKVSFHCNLTLLEKQPCFDEHLKVNVLASDCDNVEICITDIKNYEGKKYDVILMNPPYFISGKHRPSSDKRRHLCRHIKEEDLYDWFRLAHALMREEGSLFFSFRNLDWLSRVNDSWQEVSYNHCDNYSVFHWHRLKP